MGDIKLFRVGGSKIETLEATAFHVEKSLQTLIEQHLEELLGVRFLASEYSTGPVHGGRIDTLGIDENGCPVIIEYKRAVNETVVNQGLFYLDWLMDHRSDFWKQVFDRYGKEKADAIEWSGPRLLCIASDFTKYDEHAVQQINRNIELIRYRRYGNELLLFELVNATSTTSHGPESTTNGYKIVEQNLEAADDDLKDLFESLKGYLLALGDDVQMKTLKYYFAFKRIRNFACVEVYPQANKLVVYLKVSPDPVNLKDGFTRDVRKIGHFGTRDFEVTLKSLEDLTVAQPLILESYENS